LKDVFGFEPPREHGYDVVDAIRAMHDGRARVFIAMGGNFLSATPDTLYTAEALRRCDLTVQISTKLNRSHLVHGREALILPTLGRSDVDELDGERQFVTCENSMGVVQASRGVLRPVSEHLLSEPVIVARMARATLGARSVVNWERYASHYDHIRDSIEQVIPGFSKYNARVRIPGGFYLPNANREGRFETPGGKARFHAAPLSYPRLSEGEYLMMTIRSHDQFNTTIYGLDDRYRGIYNERRVVLMSPADIRRAGFVPGDVVDLKNEEGGVERVARKFLIVEYPIPDRCLATYFPETNVLVPITSVAERSNTPVSKAVVVTVRRSKSA
jgi:molybdopterin-dependent oxidoreductase alpha subunit